MKSHLSNQFIKRFKSLPDRVKHLARKNYKIWKDNPYHPSLNFKEVKENTTIYSVRVGIGWRAIGIKNDDIIVWFWIGSHSDYDKITENL
ncbi:MAG: hypothetical protein V1779_12310 [bacterium]